MPTYKDINLLTQKAAMSGTEKLPVSDTEFITPEQITEEVAENSGFYTEDAEYIRAVVDSENKLLYGVKADGDFVFGAGVPSQVQNYVSGIVGDIATLLAAI